MAGGGGGELAPHPVQAALHLAHHLWSARRKSEEQEKFPAPGEIPAQMIRKRKGKGTRQRRPVTGSIRGEKKRGDAGLTVLLLPFEAMVACRCRPDKRKKRNQTKTDRRLLFPCV